MVHSLLSSESPTEEFISREPLLLNGHLNSPVTCLAFDHIHGSKTNSSGRLASGSSDGTIIIWDILAETGLFRFLGHRGSVTDIGFVSLMPTSHSSNRSLLDGLISSSLDSLVKVWDLDGQCCIQTIANHGGEVTCSSVLYIPPGTLDATNEVNMQSHATKDHGGRWRLVSGCSDGKVRVWSITKSKRMHRKMGSDDENLDKRAEDVQTPEVRIFIFCFHLQQHLRAFSLLT